MNIIKIEKIYKYLLVCSVIFVFSTNAELVASEISKNNLFKVFERTMLKWNIDYNSLKKNKAGAACVPKVIKDSFVDKGIFSALGYSYNIESKEFAISTALNGCNQMYKNNKIDELCECIPIVFNNITNLEK